MKDREKVICVLMRLMHPQAIFFERIEFYWSQKKRLKKREIDHPSFI